MLKQVRHAWKDAFRDIGGLPVLSVRRGLQFPDIHGVENLLTDLQDFSHEATQNDWHISHDDDGDLCDIAGEFGKAMRQKNDG